MQCGRLGPPLTTVQALELDGSISLYDSATNQALVLNETATAIWRLLDGKHDAEDIVRVLSDAYGVANDRIRSDVLSALTVLSDFLTSRDDRTP